MTGAGRGGSQLSTFPGEHPHWARMEVHRDVQASHGLGRMCEPNQLYIRGPVMDGVNCSFSSNVPPDLHHGQEQGQSKQRSDRDQGSSACLREAGAWQPSFGNHSIRFNNISENKQTKSGEGQPDYVDLTPQVPHRLSFLWPGDQLLWSHFLQHSPGRPQHN